jgi:glycosyltransferase involved in cell wall biosynthesis
VHLFCIDLEGRRRQEDLEGIRVHRHPIPRWFYNKLGALSLTLPFYGDWFRRRLGPFLKENRIEVLHVHDLPLAAVGISASRSFGIPCVLDLHENFPAALRTYGYARTFLGRLLIWPSAWERFERRMVRRADHVVVVIEEARDRIVGLGVPESRVQVVPNTVDLDSFRALPIQESIADRLGEKRFRVLYTGGFDEHRGLDTALDAAALAAPTAPDLELVLVGSGRTQPRMREKALLLGMDRVVRFEGWQPFSSFPSYIQASDVGLIPHVKTPHTDSTIPHKLFHYMSLGRPVITTDCRPLERIVLETGAGLVVPHSDPQAMAEAFLRLRDAALRAKMGEAGRSAVEAGYRWDVTVEPLLSLYRDLAAPGRSGREGRGEGNGRGDAT